MDSRGAATADGATSPRIWGGLWVSRHSVFFPCVTFSGVIMCRGATFCGGWLPYGSLDGRGLVLLPLSGAPSISLSALPNWATRGSDAWSRLKGSGYGSSTGRLCDVIT